MLSVELVLYLSSLKTEELDEGANVLRSAAMAMTRDWHGNETNWDMVDLAKAVDLLWDLSHALRNLSAALTFAERACAEFNEVFEDDSADD